MLSAIVQKATKAKLSSASETHHSPSRSVSPVTSSAVAPAKMGDLFVSSLNKQTKQIESPKKTANDILEGVRGELRMSYSNSNECDESYSMKNYFGLPPYATPQSALSLIYRARGPITDSGHQDSDSASAAVHVEDDFVSNGHVADSSFEGINYQAQRKVAHALLSMVKNPAMVGHFMRKGGADALMKLIHESNDREVLQHCASCLREASTKLEFAIILIEKNILQSLGTLVERGDDTIRHESTRIIANLSMVSGKHEEMLVLNGMLGLLQTIVALTDRLDSTCYAVLAISNVAVSLVTGANDIEVAVRFCIQATRRLDVSRNLIGASFIAKIFNNFSRIPQFGSQLCEEAVLPILLRIMDIHRDETVYGFCAEAFFNCSVTKKNRREIAASGIINNMNAIFATGDSYARARLLGMIGNLLFSNFLYEKISRVDILSNILDNLMDPKQPEQFTCVVFCVAQLAAVDSSAAILVDCGVIRLTLDFLADAPSDSIRYMWNILVSLSQKPQFFDSILAERSSLFPALLRGIMNCTDGSKAYSMAVLAFNITLRPQLKAYLSGEFVDMFVKTLKTIFARFEKLRMLALNSLVNVAECAPVTRSAILSKDLISLFDGVVKVNVEMYIKFVCLLNLISCEEDCCLRLLEMGAHSALIDVQAALIADAASSDPAPSSSAVGMPPTTPAAASRTTTKVSELRPITPGVGFKLAPVTTWTAASTAAAVSEESVGLPDTSASSLGDLARCLIAATLHNMSVKRSLLGPGVLTMVMSLMKNTKSIRLLYCVRCLARVSVHSKGKLLLTKEPRLIPLLTATIRCGAEEAERVQHYCAMIVCNILASKLDPLIVDDLCKAGAFVDLVVVTLLRVNSITTKESLGKSLFNVLCRADVREKAVTQFDVLAAMLELMRIDSSELLELSIRAVFNISCQIQGAPGEKFASKMRQLKIPAIIVARTCSSTTLAGAKPTAAVKYICGMTLANISCDADMAFDLARENVPDSAAAILGLGTDEASLCASILLFNMSIPSTCVSMAKSCAVPILSTIIAQGPILCTTLCAAALCNLSIYEIFHEQLTAVALGPMIKILASPQLHISIKLDARRFLYNLVTVYQPARAVAIVAEATGALWQLVKSQNDEDVLISVGRITKEMCSEASDDVLHKKLLADGVMNLLLKLAKVEIPELKFDVSCSIFHLTTGGDTMKLLKWDSVDILFWLTLHDCLNLTDPIRMRVARAMRNFSTNAQEARVLVKEDRFMAILRAFAKSKNEDVLWQAAGIVYNLISVEECRKIALSRGITSLIFELASSGIQSVRQVCSATLHMTPDSLPDMEDPAVLQLLLCILDTDSDKLAEVTERCLAPPPAQQAVLVTKSPYALPSGGLGGNSFKANWTTVVCDVDAEFIPATSPLPPSLSISVSIKPLAASSAGGEAPVKILFENIKDLHKVGSFDRDAAEDENGGDNDFESEKTEKRLVAEINMPTPSVEPRSFEHHSVKQKEKSVRTPRGGGGSQKIAVSSSTNDRTLLSSAGSTFDEKYQNLTSKSMSSGGGGGGGGTLLPKLLGKVPLPSDTLAAIKGKQSVKFQSASVGDLGATKKKRSPVRGTEGGRPAVPPDKLEAARSLFLSSKLA